MKPSREELLEKFESILDQLNSLNSVQMPAYCARKCVEIEDEMKLIVEFLKIKA